MRRPRIQSLLRFGPEGVAAAGKVLICGLNNISPHCFNRLLALGCEVVPGLTQKSILSGSIVAYVYGLGHGFGAQDPITMRASTAKLGMKPAIIPIKKHQVASIVVSPVRSNTCL
jgi:hypothetical protein